MRRSDETIQSLTKKLIGDSIERKRWLKKLIDLVRADEREKCVEEEV